MRPSIYGPILSELTPLMIEVSLAMAELKIPAEFSLRSNHPMFFFRISVYISLRISVVTFSPRVLAVNF
jgi:hypothetical protein